MQWAHRYTGRMHKDLSNLSSPHAAISSFVILECRHAGCPVDPPELLGACASSGYQALFIALPITKQPEKSLGMRLYVYSAQ